LKSASNDARARRAPAKITEARPDYNLSSTAAADCVPGFGRSAQPLTLKSRRT